MKPRQTIERTWGVWILNNHPSNRTPIWEPWDEGYETKRNAHKALASNGKQYPDETFALVFTVNTRFCPTQARPK